MRALPTAPWWPQLGSSIADRELGGADMIEQPGDADAAGYPSVISATPCSSSSAYSAMAALTSRSDPRAAPTTRHPHPPPRKNLTRHHGIFAPAHRLRSAIVPAAPRSDATTAAPAELSDEKTASEAPRAHNVATSAGAADITSRRQHVVSRPPPISGGPSNRAPYSRPRDPDNPGSPRADRPLRRRHLQPVRVQARRPGLPNLDQCRRLPCAAENGDPAPVRPGCPELKEHRLPGQSADQPTGI